MSASTRRRHHGARSRVRKVALLTAAAAMPLGLAGTAFAATPAHAGSDNGAPVQPSHINVTHVCSQSVGPGMAACFAMRQTNNIEPAHIRAQAVTPNATPNGFAPSDLQSAYSLPSATAGSGQTVAIVDAYDDPNAESDLAQYRRQYGLPDCTTANGCFTKVGQNGSTSSLPSANTGWAGEISLDVDMVSAACPKCHILLVEADSASMANLGQSVNTAVQMGAKYVSNSYGGGISSSDPSTDNSYFKHAGTIITASTGDSAYGAEYPATSQYVTAVGGTALKRNSNTSRGWSESVWYTNSTEGGSSGCSTYESKPAFQNNLDTGCNGRAEADVSMVADPATGVAVYQTYGGSGWAVYGGTSASSPLFAATAALAGAAGNSSYGNDLSYANAGQMNDVTQGNNGSCSPSILCTAGTGWDGPTGNGTPNGVGLFGGGATQGVSVTNPGSKSSTVGTPVSLQLAASGGQSPYTWTASGLPAGLSISSSGLITGTPTTAGTSRVTVSAKDAAATTGTGTFAWQVTKSGGGQSGTVTVTSPGMQINFTGDSIRLQVKASDSADSTLTYSAKSLPAGLSINKSTGVISGTATSGSDRNATITATDAGGAHSSATFEWWVIDWGW